MPDVVWGSMRVDAITANVQSIGSQPGPPGGDGWQIVARLRASQLQAGRHYAFVVNGHLQNIQTSGSSPTYGLAQVCLGDSLGTKHPEYRMAVQLGDPSGQYVAVPFQFLVVFSASPSITDPLWGSTWANTADLVIWARVFRNGDPANYAASFDVANITWLWFDLDSIPGTHQLVEEYYPARPPSGSPVTQAGGGGYTNHFLTTNQPGSAGQQWLHFVNLWFTPLDYGQGAPQWQHGYVTDGFFTSFVPMAGAAGRWGMSTRGSVVHQPGQELPHAHLGSFFPLTQPAGSAFAIGFRGRDFPGLSVSNQTLIHRWRYLGIRIEALPEVSTLSLTNGSAGARIASHINMLGQSFAPHEPGPRTGRVAVPIYLTHGILDEQFPGTRSHAWYQLTHRGRALWAPNSFVKQVNQINLREGVPVLGFGMQGIGQDGLDIRYENNFVRIDGELPPLGFQVADAHFVQLWLVQDPSILPPTNPSPGAPVVIVPQREGVAIASQQDLPIAPDSATTEAPEEPNQEIAGITGYRRSWPLFTGPRRFWTLTWSALRNAQKLTLEAFLAGNLTFRWRPPQESGNVALLALDVPAFDLVDPTGLWQASLRVAELVWVGP